MEVNEIGFNTMELSRIAKAVAEALAEEYKRGIRDERERCASRLRWLGYDKAADVILDPRTQIG